MQDDDRPHRSARSYAVVPVLGGVELLSATYESHVFPPHAHETLVLATVEVGRIEVQCEGRTHAVAPGDVLVIAPGAIHSAWSPTAVPWQYRAVYLREEQRASLLAGVAGEEPSRVAGAAVLRDPEVAAALDSAHAALAGFARDPRSAARAVHPLRDVLEECSRALRTADRAPRPSDRIARVQAHIEQHLHRRVTLEELAEVAGMSRFGLVRVFSDALGVSPYAYFMQRRLDHARHLLACGGDISNTAHRLGFADQSHLTRWFLRVVGVTPGEYLRARQGAGARSVA